MVLRDMKMQLNNPKEIKIILDWAIEKGYKFDSPSHLTIVLSLKKVFLYFRKTSQLTYSFGSDDSDLKFFKNHNFEQVFIYDIINNNQQEIWF